MSDEGLCRRCAHAVATATSWLSRAAASALRSGMDAPHRSSKLPHHRRSRGPWRFGASSSSHRRREVGGEGPHALASPCEVLAHCFDDTRKRTTPARLVAAGLHDRSPHP
jgi:hypothetical protein